MFSYLCVSQCRRLAALDLRDLAKIQWSRWRRIMTVNALRVNYLPMSLILIYFCSYETWFARNVCEPARVSLQLDRNCRWMHRIGSSRQTSSAKWMLWECFESSLSVGECWSQCSECYKCYSQCSHNVVHFAGVCLHCVGLLNWQANTTFGNSTVSAVAWLISVRSHDRDEWSDGGVMHLLRIVLLTLPVRLREWTF